MMKKILTSLLVSSMLMVAMGTMTLQSYAEQAPSGATASGPAPSASNPAVSGAPAQGEIKSNSNPVGAQDSQLSESLKKAIDDAVVMIIFVLKGLYALLMPILALIGFFLSNNWVTGASLGIDGLIEVVWQIVRNIVNIGIVLYLLYLAGANIIPFGDQGKTNIKEQLPKVLIALIVVNFSLLFCRTVLTIGNIATSMAFSIPSSIDALVSSDGDGQAKFFIYDEPYTKESKSITSCNPGDILVGDMCSNGETTYAPSSVNAGTDTRVIECFHKNYYFRFTDPIASGNEGQSIIANPVMTADGNFETGLNHSARVIVNVSTAVNEKQRQEMITAARTEIRNNIEQGVDNYYSDCITSFKDVAFSAQNAMYVYAFNLMRIPSYELAFADATSLTKLGVSMLVAIVLLGMFMIVNIALLVAVVVRAFLLWIMMALSPLWVYTEIMKIWNNDDENAQAFIGGFGRFFNLAMMPAYVGLVLSFGFIIYQFLLVYGAASTGPSGISHIPLGSLNFYFGSNDRVIGGLGSIWGLMFPIIALIALWTAVFAAIKFGFQDNAIFRKVVKPIQDFGNSAGKFVGKLPMEAQMIPIPGKGLVTPRAIAGLPGALSRQASVGLENRNNKFIQNLTGSNPVKVEIENALNDMEKSRTGMMKFSNSKVQSVIERHHQDENANKLLLAMVTELKKMTNNGKTAPARSSTFTFDNKTYTLDKDHVEEIRKQGFDQFLTRNNAVLNRMANDPNSLSSTEKQYVHQDFAKIGFNPASGTGAGRASLSGSNITYEKGTGGKSSKPFGSMLGSMRSSAYTYVASDKTALHSIGVTTKADADILASVLQSQGGIPSRISYKKGTTTTMMNLKDVIADIIAS